jgi:hypothetical protein
MNQYRCETCKTCCPYNFNKSDDEREFDFDERIRYGNIRLHTKKKGCASHSDFRSERDKVLELLNDLRRYANGEYKEADLSDNEHDLRIHLEYGNRIWGIMKELRQQAGEQG